MDEAKSTKPNTRKQIILVVVIFVVLICINIALYMALKQPFIPTIPNQTGAIIENDLTNEQRTGLDQFYALMEAAPINTEGFQITANYDKVRLDVQFAGEADYEALNSWLENNGYTQIPDGKVVVVK